MQVGLIVVVKQPGVALPSGPRVIPIPVNDSLDQKYNRNQGVVQRRAWIRSFATGMPISITSSGRPRGCDQAVGGGASAAAKSPWFTAGVSGRYTEPLGLNQLFLGARSESASRVSSCLRSAAAVRSWALNAGAPAG